MSFKPNELRPEDVEDLEPWQLLVAACHFGPHMSGCVLADYGYKFEDKVRWISEDKMGIRKTLFCGNTSLEDDIEISDPMTALKQYAGFDWKEWARERLKKVLAEYWEEDDDA